MSLSRPVVFVCSSKIQVYFYFLLWDERREKMEHMVIIGMMDGKSSRARPREKMTEGTEQWFFGANVAIMQGTI